MKKRSGAGAHIRHALIAAVAAAGAAMFIAAAKTKLLPVTYLAALAGILTVLGAAVVLVLRQGQRLRFCTGILMAGAYVLMAGSGCGMALRTEQALNSVIATSPPFIAPTPIPTPEPTATPVPTPTATPEPVFPRVFTIYVSGIDSREGLVDYSFSDVNILFTVNLDTRQVLVVTTPRDAFVPLSISNGVRDKLTHAGQYGIDVLVDTMEMLYGTDIDYWFRLDFSGFKRMIDTLGGVTVYSDYTFTPFDGIQFHEGTNTLDGEKALIFARERKSFPDGDVQRGRDQFNLISAMADKVLSPDILGRYTEVLDAMEGCFETSIPYDLIAQLVRTQLEEDPDWNIVPYQLNGTSDNQITYRYPDRGELYVLWLDDTMLTNAKNMMASVRDGQIISLP